MLQTKQVGSTMGHYDTMAHNTNSVVDNAVRVKFKGTMS